MISWKEPFNHKNVFLHIPGLKITQIKITRNVVDVFGTLTTWRHMKTSSLEHKDPDIFWLRVRLLVEMEVITVFSWKEQRRSDTNIAHNKDSWHSCDINRFLHESLLKIWDFFHECEKRRRISHTSGKNSKSKIFNRDECKNLFLPFLTMFTFRPRN